MIAPLSGSYDGIPKLVLHATDASEMLDLCNDLAGGNICHVLCDIGSAEAVEALGKVASLAAKALFSKPMQTGCLLRTTLRTKNVSPLMRLSACVRCCSMRRARSSFGFPRATEILHT